MSVVVTQADRDAAAEAHLCRGMPRKEASAMREGRSDDHWLVQAFARHRTEATEELLEALEDALRIIAKIDEYQRRPERGDWGVECACCMGELLDDDREAIGKIRAAIARARGEQA